VNLVQSKQAPAVSVVIPTYQHADTIGQTLQSVFSQTFKDFEVIVVNDGSLDGTVDIVAPFVASGKIRYFTQQNAGQAAARNRGAAEARGKFFAFLDDDDLWPPDKLEWQVKYLEANPDVGVVAGWCKEFRGEMLGLGAEQAFASELKDAVDLMLLARGNPIIFLGQTLIYTDLFRELGGFDPDISGVDDYDFWFRAVLRNRIQLVPRIALFHRNHPGNFSKNADQMFASCLLVARRHLSTASPTLQPELFEAFYRQLYNFAGHRLTRDWAFLWNDPHHLWSRLRSRGKSLFAIMSERNLRRLFLHGLMKAVRRRGHDIWTLARIIHLPDSLRSVLWKNDRSRTIKTKLRKSRVPLAFRPGTSDLIVLRKVFLESEYELPFLIPVRTVVDAGAHIGAATLFYHDRFPDARILAIEPEQSNYELLCKNTETISNVIAMRAALWPHEEQLWIQDTATDKAAFQVSTAPTNFSDPVPPITPEQIFEKLQVDRIDLLKLDIEGTELDLFASDTEQWLPRVRCLVLELHDRMRPGCARSLYRALREYDFKQEIRGENIFILLSATESNA
jgi:FkbM family methyltransferase